MILSLSAGAERELVEATRYYAQQGSLAIGEAFVLEFERCCVTLLERPQLGVVFHPSPAIRRLRMRRFPYGIFYDVQGTTLRVLAIAHERRRPGYWRGRR